LLFVVCCLLFVVCCLLFVGGRRPVHGVRGRVGRAAWSAAARSTKWAKPETHLPGFLRILWIT
ncbi:hypothetical protein J2D73_15655, partial [Acetobacter sacchari]